MENLGFEPIPDEIQTIETELGSLAIGATQRYLCPRI